MNKLSKIVNKLSENGGRTYISPTPGSREDTKDLGENPLWGCRRSERDGLGKNYVPSPDPAFLARGG